ncbi:hypothetical protein SteCoe_17660 [Stentor coeruleus]|uniref:EF-hand domain-containing protein n=1 Tax=Stentor coeruleus TaxID=5963 RepID=A0A1R2BYB3_9CILI|nr:hypothetical protein SteCoe_17660 [Stentor coeruleus]
MKLLRGIYFACVVLQVLAVPTVFLQDEKSDDLAEDFAELLEAENSDEMTVEELEILLDAGYELLESLDGEETVTISGEDYDEEQLEELLVDIEEDLTVQKTEDEISEILASCLQDDGTYIIPEEACQQIFELYESIVDLLDEGETISVNGNFLEQSDIESLLPLFEYVEFDYLILYEDGSVELITEDEVLE